MALLLPSEEKRQPVWVYMYCCSKSWSCSVERLPVFSAGKDWIVPVSGTARQCRIAREMEYRVWFDTIIEAKEYVLKRAKKALKEAQKKLDRCKGIVATCEALEDN